MLLPDGPRSPWFLQTLQIIAQPTRFLDACSQQYGDTFTLRVFGPQLPVIFVSRPESVQAVFTTLAPALELGQLAYIFEPLTGTQSLIVKQGRSHQRLRSVLSPSLQGQALSRYGSNMQQTTRMAIQAWSVGDTLNSREWMGEIALQVILRVVFGLESGPHYNQLKAYLHKLLDSVTSPWYSVQFFLPFLQQDWGSWSPWHGFLTLREAIDTLVYAEIQDRRQSGAFAQDVLSLLLQARDEAGEPLSDQELRDQLMTLLLLGHETTASGLTWLLYWLHRYPAVLEQIRIEIEDSQDPVAVTNLPYLHAVCQEVLRLYPIALIAQPRIVKDAIELEGYTLNPGTALIPCIYTAHHRTEAYPDPFQFRPERFQQDPPSLYEYFPFGGGSRRCIGMALAMFEMKVVLAEILRHYQFKAPMLSSQDPGVPIRRGITFVPPWDWRLEVTEVLL